MSSNPYDIALSSLLGNVPDTWNTLQEFMKWYLDNRIPFLVPNGCGTVVTDDATAVPIFRRDRFQVEFYIIHPQVNIKLHSHPDIETITFLLGGEKTLEDGYMGTSGNFNKDYPIVAAMNEKHGKFSENGYSNEGFAMLSFQRWNPGVPITSAALNWKGPSAGPIHDKLLGR